MSPRVLSLFLLMAVGACGRGGPSEQKRAPTSRPMDRLHPAGELRLTSAGREPRLRLRYDLTVGHRQGYRTTVSVHHQAAGQTASLSAVLDWERTLLDRQGDRAGASITVRRVRQIRPAGLRENVLSRLKSLSLRYTVDARGQIRIARQGSGLPASLPQGALQDLSAPLPSDPVGNGATWERYEPIRLVLPKLHHPLSLGVRTRYTLKIVLHKQRERFAVISAKMNLTPRSARVEGAGHGTATLKIDLRSSRVVSGQAEMQLNLKLVTAGRRQTVQQTIKTSTRAVKLPPPGSTPPKR